MTLTTSGYDVARPAQHDGVADAHVLALQFLDVVERRVGDRRSAHEHGIESRHRRQRAGAADLPFDRANPRHLLVCGKLVRERPARRARDESEFPLQVQRVDLVDDAVDLVAERAPRRPMSS